jgi:large subunit ribosomal protein L25
MSEVHTSTANKRDRAGKGAARATRREGHVPGVIYGNKQSPVLIALDPREIDREIHKKGFYTTLFDLKVGGDAHRVLARDIQFDPVTDRVVHADFMRVTNTTRVRVHVPVAFTNEGLSPGIKRGGVLNVVRHRIAMYVPAEAIPEFVEVDLTGLDIGDSVHISAIPLPEGVTPTIRDRDFTVATIAGAASVLPEVEEGAAAAEGEAAEGEVAAAGEAGAEGEAKPKAEAKGEATEAGKGKG